MESMHGFGKIRGESKCDLYKFLFKSSKKQPLNLSIL